MKIQIVKDYNEMSCKTAQIIADEIRKKPDLIMALPTGGTPAGTLNELVKIYQDGGLDFSRVVSFNIDEYVSLKPDNPQSYYYYLNEYLYRHVNIKIENTFVPNVLERDTQKACKDYDALIAELGDWDIVLLGIGNDGHIGFNLPEAELFANTHIENLNEDTIQANSRFFERLEEVPRQAMTSGVGIILKAKKIVLIANGENKAGAIAKLINQPVITPWLPASLLWLHRDVTIIIDEAAAELCIK
jgi:glucosamine-6-phosphate deaminase